MTIGKGAVIGGNVWITQDVPEGARAFCRNARVSDADLRRPARRVSRPLPVGPAVGPVGRSAGFQLRTGRARVQPKGQVQTSIGRGALGNTDLFAPGQTRKRSISQYV